LITININAIVLYIINFFNVSTIDIILIIVIILAIIVILAIIIIETIVII